MINKSADLMLSSVREQLYVPACIPVQSERAHRYRR